MTVPLILGALWVIAAAITAMLPMRRQYVPGQGNRVSYRVTRR